jgi:hypothetical protein
MNILHMNGQVFDLNEVVSKVVEGACVRLTFRNGDVIPLRWRDEVEKRNILETLQMAPAL